MHPRVRKRNECTRLVTRAQLQERGCEIILSLLFIMLLLKRVVLLQRTLLLSILQCAQRRCPAQRWRQTSGRMGVMWAGCQDVQLIVWRKCVKEFYTHVQLAVSKYSILHSHSPHALHKMQRLNSSSHPPAMHSVHGTCSFCPRNSDLLNIELDKLLPVLFVLGFKSEAAPCFTSLLHTKALPLHAAQPISLTTFPQPSHSGADSDAFIVIIRIRLVISKIITKEKKENIKMSTPGSIETATGVSNAKTTSLHTFE